MKTTYCDCEDWQSGIKKINAFIFMGINHRMVYDAKKFVYCPWCGKKLKEKDED